MNELNIHEDFILGDLEFENSQLRHIIKSLRQTAEAKDKLISNLEMENNFLELQLRFYQKLYKEQL